MSRSAIAILSMSLLSGCTTYLIPIDSLRQQLGSASMVPVVVAGPLGAQFAYDANDILLIKCVGRDGQVHDLYNSPSIEVRLTLSDGKRRIMYFDRLMLHGDTLIGSRSRFAGPAVTKIPFADIVKVEVQDGKKDFVYLKR